MAYASEELFRKYQFHQANASRAQQRGDLATTKQELLAAADYLSALADLKQGEAREADKALAERMRSIANTINVPVAPGPTMGGYGGNAGGNNGASSGANGAVIPDEVSSFLEFFEADELEEGFEGVVGLEEAKAAIRKYVINPRLYPEAYKYSVGSNSAIMLEGPPGTGKTTFAKAVAKEVRQPFALIKLSALINCYVGETAKNIDKLFEFLRAYAQEKKCGITLFLDEVDEVAKKRGGDDKTSEAAVPALLRNLDGVKQNKDFLVLSNTNFKDLLDDAFLDRFRQCIYIPLPDAKVRELLFRKKLKEIEQEFLDKIDFDAVVNNSDGMNGRQINFVCEDMKLMLSEMKAGLVEIPDLNAALLQLIEERKH